MSCSEAVVAVASLAELQELLPGILNQMGPDSLMHLKKMMAQMGGGGMGGFPGAAAIAGDDDDGEGKNTPFFLGTHDPFKSTTEFNHSFLSLQTSMTWETTL